MRMEPEDKRKLDRALALAEENNAILRQIRGSQKTAKMFRAIYWVVIIALTVGSYYAAKPYIDTLTGLYSSIGGSSTQTPSASGTQMPSIKELQNLANQLNGK